MEGEAAQAAGSGAFPTAVPWGQIPKFVPGETDLRVYTRKLEFLKELWPSDYLEQLAPRAALLVEGVAFQKISRLDPTKLKQKDGVKYLVEALGGQWGRPDSEERLDMFEKALFLTVQKADESHDSYMARHDAAFEDLLMRKVTIEEVRAYILIRQSLLSSEDRKKIIFDSGGALSYEQAKKSIKLLGSKFFLELQNSSKNMPKLKTYDVNHVDDEAVLYQDTEEEMDEETAFQALLESGDEDACFVSEFEDQICAACQESQELAACFVSYQEARARLRDKAKSRGFWPLSGGKGKTKGKKGKMSSGNSSKGYGGTLGLKRRSLADRIANSTCRRCGQPGHWKRECPLANNPAGSSLLGKKNDTESFTGILHVEGHGEIAQDLEDAQLVHDVIYELPMEAEVYDEDGNQNGACAGVHVVGDPGSESECLVCFDQWTHNVSQRLHQCCRKHEVSTVAAAAESFRAPTFSAARPLGDNRVVQSAAEIFNSEEADDEAIIDTGASRAVIGSERLKRLVKSFPPELRGRVMKVPTNGVVFKFGNAGRLTSSFAVMLPRKENGWLRVEVVPGHTPFLISNAVLCGLRGVIDVEGKTLGFKGSPQKIRLESVRKNLMGIKVLELLTKAPNHANTPTHIFCAPEDEHQTMTQREQRQVQVKSRESHDHHHVHDKPIEGRIQTSTFPKECAVNDHQGNHSGMTPVISNHAAVESDQAPSVFDDAIALVTRSHGLTDGSKLLGPDAHDAHRSNVADLDQPRCPARSVDETSGNQHLDRLGSHSGTIGKTCNQDLCSHLRGRQDVCQAALEQTRSLVVGEELPALLSRAEGGQSRETTPHTWGGTISSACPADRAEADSKNGQCDLSEKQEGLCRNSNTRRGRLDSDPHRSACDGREQKWQERDDTRDKLHGDPGRSGEGAQAPDPDRDPSARVAEGDSGCSVNQGEIGVSDVLQEHLQNRVQEIEHGLVSLKVDKTYIPSNSKIVKSHGIYHKVSGQHNVDSQDSLDLMEIYCEPCSELSKQVERMGGKSLRFTFAHGDLSTPEGRQKLWEWIYIYEPRHVWVAPECRLWGNFSRFNMGRSSKMFDEIHQRRNTDRPHLVLCNQLYLHQISEGKHFHLEQPRGSEMVLQPELDDVRTGTLPATFDMCRVGKLRLPRSSDFLRKRTQVYTTSRVMFERLHSHLCNGEHDHTPIKGQFKYHGEWVNISAYAQAYTAQFARRVADVVLWERGHQEHPLLLEEIILGLEEHERPLADEALQLKKRRRVELKQPETSMYGKAPSWMDIFRTVGDSAPRVGNVCFDGNGDTVVKLVQMLVPEIKVQLVVACRGTDRHRCQPENVVPEVLPWRKTIIVDRNTGEVKDLGPPENWVNLPRAKQVRSTGPAKISVSVFGSKEDSPIDPMIAAIPKFEQGSRSPAAESGMTGLSQSPGVEAAPAVPEKEGPSEVVPKLSNQELSGLDQMEQGWAPRIIPKSGPAFLNLSGVQKGDLRRLHNNLGHPDVEKMVKFLTERGAQSEVIQAARDMVCDTCVESQERRKRSQPSRIHEALDFNDVVGADGAYWTNKKGKTFHFMHFIDEATLYHVGALSSRKVESQIETFLSTWVQWAGPCRTLYLDPAGEYVNDTWAATLQSEGIQVSMAAAEAHWQNGRAEIHGKIVKDMLNRIERDRDIDTVEEFSQCLRQVFAAKNSLSRVHGFTPEQCLLGKSRHLPGSLMSDEAASSHSLAESSSPEGVRFKESLLRRELARKAFVQADNDSSFRRAILRQSRPGKLEYEAGDWVLYWRKARGRSRIEVGRWHGPAQVIACQDPKVMWLSHLGRIIRASPEQLRPASLREYSKLPRDPQGFVLDEKPQGRGFIDLGNPEANPAEMEDEEMPRANNAPDHPVSEFSYTPTTPLESQPEGEQFPMDSTEKGSDDGEVPQDGRYVPIPDDSDDGLFGDDCLWAETNFGVWELSLLDHEYQPETAEILCCEPMVFEETFVVSNDKKRRVELDYRKLSSQDRVLFDAAKQKEVKAWLSHGTVKKLSKGILKPEQIMRCRWLLTWKEPLPGTTERRAKARLVILGFEDPGVGVVPNDAPTLSKDGRQLLLQQAASRRWRLINFDISTAFLKGEGDGRPLGIHAPPEIKRALQMREGDQCSLEGGAYGRVDAPFLWYKALRSSLESLGFVACPFDGCLFSLITQDPRNPKGRPRVRGILGIHVDDGIGAGDDHFKETIGRLRKLYEFGSYYEKEFDFCGVHYKQWDDCTIEMDQVGYVQKISPIEIPRNRRTDPEVDVTEVERQELRRVCGSLQYAAVHTRPDLAAKTGQLQSMVTKAKIKHLLEANRVLFEGKKHPVCLMIVPIPERQVAFCVFSDASFSMSRESSSRQGTLIFATDVKLSQNERTVVCPMAWSSKKIPRVVTSTLSAESMALSASLDRLGYIRIC